MSLSASKPVRIPLLAAQLSYAGLIPFILLSSALWMFQDVYHGPINAALLSYAAIILSFMGAVHWGFSMEGNHEIDKWQMGLSVMPPLVAWLASFTAPIMNYSILIVAFIGLCVFDDRLAMSGKVPAWYPSLRTPLTVVVAITLIFAQMSML